ncbi:hypothetical protein B0G76_3607 [Paraburkholderia sp. BL23I1N1]|uniref:J domain-containing protein n=1 Tax=Paraburkholderia sp. BL23I1N1 TaxID=1938802 RepID=UPI000E750690|nr:J domain-containing protein [Paraburkholderia sp. BL23I1N1]RKE37358.1 hypothetical protein B0G76_3607 [Paraburkholderia sp. BL23I1N1]
MDTTSTYHWPWDLLGIAANADERTVRRAYARLLKQQRPDEDAEAFQRLRYAYESALQMAAGAAAPVIAETASGEPAKAPVINVTPTPRASPEPAPEAPVPSAAMRAAQSREDATRLWHAFLANPDKVSLRRSVADLFESVISFSILDELEWLALCHCLNEDMPAELRTALCTVLRWRENAEHLLRRDRATATRALTRIYTDEDYLALRVRFPRAIALMDAPAPGLTRGLWALRTETVRDEMAELVPALLNYYPNVVKARGETARLDFWARCLTLRAGFSGLVGTALLIGTTSSMLLVGTLVPAEKHRSIVAWGPRELFAALAIVAIHLGIAAARLYDLAPAIMRKVHALRLSPFVRYGWVVLWLVVVTSDLATGPDPSTTPTAMVLLALCIGCAIIAHGPLRSTMNVLILAAQVAYCCGYYGHWTSVDPGSWTLPIAHGVLIALFCEFSLPALRGLLQHRPALIRLLAAGWFFGAAVFVALSMSSAPNAAQFAWCLFAVLPVAGSIIGKTSWRKTIAAVNPLAKVYLFLISLTVAIAMPKTLAAASVGLMALWILGELWNNYSAKQVSQ